ncbi:MAG: serine/threonine protein kinase [Myxococcales bacterium]|jgi:serine/threonine protein kinase|nr:serine/threonine protein kinase [Myxococcales bacterium]MBL0192655.1 serine/threonine protein kinase [Myxococcales bacterium]
MRRFGPFVLEARLAVGGTAEVHTARPAEPGGDLPERVVVKRLLPHMLAEPSARSMFDLEARLHASIRHENVVRVYFAGVDEATGEPFLALEHVDGVDGYRLLRRLKQEGRTLPVGVAVYIAREVLRALASAHTARDANGAPLHIVHRDVSPSNIYFSVDGRVKLGDFGIAHSSSRASMRSEAGNTLKGKYAYLAPEQVKGDPADHRADLFSLAAVLTEMLLGVPLFAGGGQLAVLLAIRDCKLDVLESARHSLPKGLFDVLERALSKAPDRRFGTASELAARLAPFESPPQAAITELSALVRATQAGAPSRELSAVTPGRARAVEAQATRVSDPQLRKTSEYVLEPSFVVTADGRLMGPISFAHLVEAISTGELAERDRVNYAGTGLKPLRDIGELARFLPPSTATASGALDPGLPQFQGELSEMGMLAVLMPVLRERLSGVLFAERGAGGGAAPMRKELYFQAGRLHHVASTNATELLGEYLVRRGKLAREELDLALGILPRYQGRMGDTLISLGLVDAVEIFRAIREQGRDRVADLFTWRFGKVSFYRDRTAAHVEFPLDLDLPQLLVAGLEAEMPGNVPLDRYRGHLSRTLRSRPTPRELVGVTWPASVSALRALLDPPLALREVLRLGAQSGAAAPELLRAVEVLTAAGLAAFD